VLGAGDGLLTNLSLVLGVAGAASANASAVRLAGVAGLLAGAFSMAAGELVSVRAQQEMVEREVEVERQELADDPEGELRELTGMYEARGLSHEDASTVAAVSSFLSFSIGAILPLFPWFFVQGSTAVIASVIIGAVAALALGAAIGAMAGRNVVETALRQLAVAAVAAAVTFSVGHVLGAATS
jgi:vacuolar iron transporter family protein